MQKEADNERVAQGWQNANGESEGRGVRVSGWGGDMEFALVRPIDTDRFFV